MTVMYVAVMKSETCGVDGCDRDRYCKGYCAAHYARWRAHGDPGPARIGRPPTPPCSIDECDAPAVSKGHCGRHRRRRVLYGTTDLPPRPSGPRSPTWTGEDATYAAVHLRLKARRGPASKQTCPCGRRARQWSYDHLDPNEKTDPRGGWAYSTDLDHYQALCVSCHKRRDLDKRGGMTRKPRPTPPHGDRRRYAADKCRCDLCRAANAERNREYRAAVKARQDDL